MSTKDTHVTIKPVQKSLSSSTIKSATPVVPKRVTAPPTPALKPATAQPTPAKRPIPPPLPTPCVPPTPATRAVTPVPPAKFTPADVLPKMSDAYQRLKHRAIAINAEELAERPAEAAKWRKSRLTDIERFYLWNSTGGLCGRKGCDVPLDETRMTIEHVVPKSQMPSATWDLRNLTVLCGRCNSKKGVKPCNEIATARPFRYGPMTAVAPQQAQWAGAKD